MIKIEICSEYLTINLNYESNWYSQLELTASQNSQWSEKQSNESEHQEKVDAWHKRSGSKNEIDSKELFRGKNRCGLVYLID